METEKSRTGGASGENRPESVSEESIAGLGSEGNAAESMLRKSEIQYGVSSILGTRESQQDAVLFRQCGERYLAAVCDGMGGLNGGELASRTAVTVLEKDFGGLEDTADLPAFLREEAVRLDEQVCALADSGGKLLEAGTTIVAVIVQGQKMYWLSAGDSRIYLFRDGEIYLLTRDHNYRLSLDILLRKGMISEQRYLEEDIKGEALISYLGVGNISLIDGNTEPILLKQDDRILLCSDGLYRSVEEEQILDLVLQYEDMQQAARALTDYVELLPRRSQDNTSMVLMRYSEQDADDTEKKEKQEK